MPTPTDTPQTVMVSSEMGRPVPLADGPPFPAFASATVQAPGSAAVEFNLLVEDGQVVVDRVTVERYRWGEQVDDLTVPRGPGLTPDDLRRLPWARLLKAAIGGCAAVSARSELRGEDDLARRLAVGEAAGEAAVRVRRNITETHLRYVAQIVRAHPQRATDAVAKQMHTGNRNARRWIVAAEKRGFLTMEEER
jgi:hypothetical protein